MNLIQVEHLTKRYGAHPAIEDLTFTLQPGKVYGFLGPNGAGKSTTMNIMTGALAATDGTVSVDGHDIFSDAEAAKRKIGYLPENPPLYMDMTPREYLTFIAEAKGITKADKVRQVTRVMGQTKITEIQDRLISQLSKGYRQRVGIAQAILGEPDVILLDEPTVGLDPQQLTEIRALIRELGKRKTVVFSSHILAEISAVCDEVLIVSNGRLVAFDTMENLRERYGAGRTAMTLRVKADGHPDDTEKRLTKVMEAFPQKQITRANGVFTCRISADAFPDDLCEEISCTLTQAGFVILQMSVKEVDLEDVFLLLTGKRPGNTNFEEEPAQ